MRESDFMALDIETAKPFPNGADWRDHRPLGIACAVTRTHEEQRNWFGEDDEGAIAERMTRAEANLLVDHLVWWTHSGKRVLTWNGMGFDLPVLAEESGRLEDCRWLARRHVDMMYHIVCERGYPLSMSAASLGMGCGKKTQGITGNDAPFIWQTGNRETVIEYCGQDTAITLALGIECNRAGELRWRARSGKQNRLALPRGWLPVREAQGIRLPDTSWMTDPTSRENFDHWLKDGE